MTTPSTDQVSVLRQIREALQAANDDENGPITDTIWMCGVRNETLFDFIDAAIEEAERAAIQPAEAWKYRVLTDKHTTGAVRPDEIQLHGVWGRPSGWMVQLEKPEKEFLLECIQLSSAPAAIQPAGDAVRDAQFNGFDVSKLPPILISCVAKLWPGSNGLFWESAIEKMPARIEQLLSTTAAPVASAPAQPSHLPKYVSAALHNELSEAYAKLEDEHEALLASVAPAQLVGNAERVDAARWRAMLDSARIRIIGCAGIREPEDGYAHFGMEIWTKYGSSLSTEQTERMKEGNVYGREVLTKYADIARSALATQQGDKHE